MSALAAGREPATTDSLPEPTLPTPPVSLLTTLLSMTWQTVASLVITVVLLYFSTGAGDLFLSKTVRLAPNLRDKKNAVEISRKLEFQISRYLVLVTAINAGLGLAWDSSSGASECPTQPFWGVLAFALNFIPYLGGSLGIAIVLAVALLTFQNLGWALLPPLAYFLCFFIEGNFVTPHLMGRRMI